MDKVKFDYRRWLKARAADAQEAREDASPISLTQYRAQRDRDRWLAKMAAIASGKTPPDAA